MKTSQRGIDFIREFEGCRLTAYKPVPTEKYYTIGVGHYGPDVTEGMVITKAQAEQLLRDDLNRFEKAVDAQGLKLTQNQFDALVSFAYNCGAGNLTRLCKGRSLAQIADAIPLYDMSNGKPLSGLTRRRKAEQNMFLSSGTGNPYTMPTKTLRQGDRGDEVKWLQYELNKHDYKLKVDGIFGPATDFSVRDYQNVSHLVSDGLVGPRTRESLIKEG